MRISEKRRDSMRETLFKDAYGLDVQIHVTNFNDDAWNWEKVILNFRDSIGKNYGLVEYFRPGDDNSTLAVDFEWEDASGAWKRKTFLRFVDAENEMVELIKNRIEGKG